MEGQHRWPGIRCNSSQKAHLVFKKWKTVSSENWIKSRSMLIHSEEKGTQQWKVVLTHSDQMVAAALECYLVSAVDIWPGGVGCFWAKAQSSNRIKIGQRQNFWRNGHISRMHSDKVDLKEGVSPGFVTRRIVATKLKSEECKGGVLKHQGQKGWHQCDNEQAVVRKEWTQLLKPCTYQRSADDSSSNWLFWRSGHDSWSVD